MTKTPIEEINQENASDLWLDQLDEGDLQAVIDLSLEIFKPNTQTKENYHSLQKWSDNFSHGGLLLGAFVADKLVGFTFNYDREPGQKTSHLWLSGVLEEHRGQGIYTRLMELLAEVLKQKGYEFISVNTNPTKFPAMYAYLTKNNFQITKEEKLDDGSTKVFLQKQL